MTAERRLFVLVIIDLPTALFLTSFQTYSLAEKGRESTPTGLLGYSVGCAYRVFFSDQPYAFQYGKTFSNLSEHHFNLGRWYGTHSAIFVHEGEPR